MITLGFLENSRPYGFADDSFKDSFRILEGFLEDPSSLRIPKGLPKGSRKILPRFLEGPWHIPERFPWQGFLGGVVSEDFLGIL